MPEISMKRRRQLTTTRSAKRRRTPYRPTQAQRINRTVLATKELKFFDGSKGNTNLSTTGTILEDSLVTIAAGTGESNRIGRRISVRSIHIRGVLKADSTSDPTLTGNRARVILYHDKQANGATATVAGLLEDSDINGFRNLTNTGRFSILMDQEWDLNSLCGAYDGTNDQFGEAQYGFKFNKKCDIPIEYSSTTGAITEITSNNIGIMAISEEATGVIQFRWRIRYTDS